MKLYVIVRKNIPKTWWPVQACHAVKEYYRGEPKSPEHLSVIILSVEDLVELTGIYDLLKSYDTNASIFSESYNSTGYTATCGILNEEEQKQVRDLKLLSY